MSMQAKAIAALKERLPSTGQVGALVAIDPANGYIRVMSASTDFKTYQYGLAWQAQRQPGSTMKPFALIAAVEQHANPATTFYNSHPLHIYLGPGANPPYWDVYTAEKSAGGRMNLVQATLASDNTVFAQLCLDLGPAAIVKVAHQMGVTTKLIAEPSIVLGSEDVNVLEMADAYATMASEGIHHSPQAIEKVVFPNGRVVKTRIKGNRVLSAGVAYTVDKILEQNTSYAGGTAASMPNYYRGRSAGKTGTTDNYKDAWFNGFNPKLATAVWMGYIDSRPMYHVFGATYSLPIWGTFYNSVFGSQDGRRLQAAFRAADIPAVDGARRRQPAPDAERLSPSVSQRPRRPATPPRARRRRDRPRRRRRRPRLLLPDSGSRGLTAAGGSQAGGGDLGGRVHAPREPGAA